MKGAYYKYVKDYLFKVRIPFSQKEKKNVLKLNFFHFINTNYIALFQEILLL